MLPWSSCEWPLISYQGYHMLFAHSRRPSELVNGIEPINDADAEVGIKVARASSMVYFDSRRVNFSLHSLPPWQSHPPLPCNRTRSLVIPPL